VTAQERKVEEPGDVETRTLGELLDVDSDRGCVSEREWVALVRSIAGRDKVALYELFQRSHRLAFTLIMRIVPDRRTAEALTLDVFHDVWQRASSYDEAENTVLGWIMNQARSRAIERKTSPDETQHDPHAADPWGAAIEAHAHAVHLRDALALLSAEERLAIETTFFSELTCAEAAERLGQPLGALKTRIRTGLEKLRATLAKQVGEP
jgi:RNA polymerase sigma-70 factor (ECF subfamily)